MNVRERRPQRKDAMVAAPALHEQPPNADPGGLAQALRRLDALLDAPDAVAPSTAAVGLATELLSVDRFATLARVAGLDHTDLALLLIALAPDLDLRHARQYGLLQDDAARRRPSLDLCLRLLAPTAAEGAAVGSRLSCGAPLLQQRVLEITGDPLLPLPARELRVDAVWRAWLLQAGIEDALPATCRLESTDAVLPGFAVEPETLQLLESACANATRAPLRLWLHGEHGAGKLATARAVALRLGWRLMVMDVRDLSAAAEIADAVERAARVALLFGGVLYVHGLQRLEQRDPQLVRALLTALAAAPCALVVSCLGGPPPLHAAVTPWVRVGLPYPAAALRLLLWQRALQALDARADADDLSMLSERFSLSAAQIAQAATEAQALATLRDQPRLRHADMAVTVRQQCGSELARMATRITPRARLGGLVSAAEVQAQLREICERVGTRHSVGKAWSDTSVHARQTGVTALFVGPSGTGKTLAAESVANELGLDLYRIDLAGVVSKYIGQTEKNLDRVFAAAEHSNAVLFFDEADALFGKRSEVKDAHDRYANIEVAYLLQKMEQFNGLAILATNLKQSLDEAFARRLTFTVNFPFPEEGERRRLWEQLWPERAPRGDDIDLAWFAREFRLSGGNIRNTVVAAAHLAAAGGQAITREHLLHATRREFQKLGKNLVQREPAA